MSHKKAKKPGSKKKDLLTRYREAKVELNKLNVEVSAVVEEFDKRLSDVENKLEIEEPYSNLHERLEDIERRLASSDFAKKEIMGDG